MARDIAIVLNSGSLNSVVVTALANQRHRPVLLHAQVAEGQGKRAQAAFEQQVAHFQAHRQHILPMQFLSAVASATQAAAAANDPRQEKDRGGSLLEMLPLVATAALFASHHRATAIYLGLRVGPGADELAQATEYMQVWNELIQLPCRAGEIELVMPIVELEQWQVVDIGFQVEAPLEKTWSCVSDGEKPCGVCRGCRLREAAFVQAAKADPLPK